MNRCVQLLCLAYLASASSDAFAETDNSEFTNLMNFSSLDYSYNDYDCGLIPHDQLLFKFVLIGVFGTLIILFGVFGNVASIIIFCKPKLRLPNNYFLIALAVFDTLLLICAFLVYCVEYINQYAASLTLHKVWMCYITGLFGINSIALTGSIYMTLAAAAERLISVALPNYSQRFCYKIVAAITILCVACFAVLFNITKFLEIKVERNPQCEEDTFQAFTLVATLLARSVVYWNVYNLWIRSIVVNILPYFLLIVLTIFNCVLLGRNRPNRRYGQVDTPYLREATVVVIAVVVLFLVCNFLGLVLNVLELFIGVGKLHLMFEEFYSISREATNFLIIINSSVKFCIYCIFSQRFRKEFVTVFCCRERNLPNLAATEQAEEK